MPDEPEVHGLLALMQIQHARREARFSGDELVLLEDQDRSLWDAQQIAAGRTALERALALRGRGPYVLQAAIASLQAEERIDWNEVAALYGQLAQITHSPVVELNRAVAVAQAGATEQALEIVDGLDLDDYQYLHSTRGELLRRLGRTMRRAKRTTARSSSPAHSPSVASSSAGSPSCNRSEPPGRGTWSPRRPPVRRQCVAITRPGGQRDDTPTTDTTRELDSRLATDRRPAPVVPDGPVLAVPDTKTGEAFELAVREGERALEVFHHPYAYAARPQHRRVPITASHSS